MVKETNFRTQVYLSTIKQAPSNTEAEEMRPEISHNNDKKTYRIYFVSELFEDQQEKSTGIQDLKDRANKTYLELCKCILQVCHFD